MHIGKIGQFVRWGLIYTPTSEIWIRKASFLFRFVWVLGMESSALHMLVKCCNAEPHSQPSLMYILNHFEDVWTELHCLCLHVIHSQVPPIARGSTAVFA